MYEAYFSNVTQIRKTWMKSKNCRSGKEAYIFLPRGILESQKTKKNKKNILHKAINIVCTSYMEKYV